MPSIEIGTVQKTLLPIIYVIDTSDSMSGDRIACVNKAMRESIKVMKGLAENILEFKDIKVGVLRFSTGAEWVTNGLVDLEHFDWNDLTASGGTDLGAALKELNKELNRCVDGYPYVNTPMFVFVSDGCPTDDWENSFSELMDNRWFRYGRKWAFVIGDDVDVQCFTKLTGSKAMVFTRPKLLKDVTRFMQFYGGGYMYLKRSQCEYLYDLHRRNGDLWNDDELFGEILKAFDYDFGDADEFIGKLKMWKVFDDFFEDVDESD